jgi:hypothetical protein
MNESQSPEQKPTSQALPAEKPKTTSSPKTTLPDWKPLGTIRDYFSEQLKQDQQRW